MTSNEIQQIVTEVYTTHDLLPSEWTPQQRQDFLDREAGRISRQVASLAAEMTDQAVQDWISRHGDHPDFLTKAGLVNNVTNQAKHLVLSQELYELIPPPADEPLEDNLEDSSARLPDRSQVRGTSGGLTRRTGPNRPRIKRTWWRRCGQFRTSRRCSGSRRST